MIVSHHVCLHFHLPEAKPEVVITSFDMDSILGKRDMYSFRKFLHGQLIFKR